jgi:hypothetical protein
MALGSIFGGGKVKRPPRPAAEAALYDIALQQRGMATAMLPLARARVADVADPSDEIRRQRGLARLDGQQAVGRMSTAPVTRTTAFDRAMQRARGLTRVAMMGEQAARMQAIRDRAAIADFGSALRRGQAGDVSALANSQAAVDAARMQARQIQQAGYANLLGTIGGLGLAYAGPKIASAAKDFFYGPRPIGGIGAGGGTLAPITTVDQLEREGMLA